MSIDEKLSIMDKKLSLLKDSDMSEELEKQSKKRTKIAVAFLLAVLADWILSFIIPILTGRAPLTLEATFVSFLLILFYMAFVGIEKMHHHFDIKTIKDWIDINERANTVVINRVRAEEMVSLDVELQKRTIQLRDDSIRDLITKGTSMFNVQGSSPAQRSDWTPMTEAFVRIIRDVDRQLLQSEMKEHALILLEEKIPTLKESIEAILKHMKSLEEREKKRDEILIKLSSDFGGLKARVIRIEKVLNKS